MFGGWRSPVGEHSGWKKGGRPTKTLRVQGAWVPGDEAGEVSRGDPEGLRMHKKFKQCPE